jgi:hypothetical protein
MKLREYIVMAIKLDGMSNFKEAYKKAKEKNDLPNHAVYFDIGQRVNSCILCKLKCSSQSCNTVLISNKHLFGLLAYNPIELSFELSTIHGLSIIVADVDEPTVCLIAR